MPIANKRLKRQIIQMSYDNKLSHIGSCLTAVDIIKDAFDRMDHLDKFVLSQGHAGLALYVVMEASGYGDAQEMLLKSGIHPDRLKIPVDCSTGSLGHGLPIAVGMAIAKPDTNVFCLTSDGELMEGSMFEAIRIMGELGLDNLQVYVNANGYGAYKEIPIEFTKGFQLPNVEVVETNTDYLPFLNQLNGHYRILTKEDYSYAMEILE